MMTNYSIDEIDSKFDELIVKTKQFESYVDSQIAVQVDRLNNTTNAVTRSRINLKLDTLMKLKHQITAHKNIYAARILTPND